MLGLGLLTLACAKGGRTNSQLRDAGPAGAVVVSAAAPASSVDVLPIGHWESNDVPGSKLCLTLMGQGFYRITATVPHYRNDARVSGRIIDVRAGKAPRSFDITLSVRSIIAKEVGRCRKNWVNYRLPAADLLGVRVTPTEGSEEVFDREDPWTGQLDDGGAVTPKEPPKRFSIQFDEAFEHVEMCASPDQPRDAEAGRCRTLKKTTSPTTKMLVGYSYGCNSDADCGQAYEGEMCSPCKCMNAAYNRGEPGSTHNKQVGDWLAATRDTEHECRLPRSIPSECPRCVDAVARCVDHRCKLEREGGG